MLGQLTNLLGKHFAIGYFLPAILLAFGFLELAHLFDKLTDLQINLISGGWVDNIYLALFIALFAVFLLALNFNIIRFLEGYHRFNPFRLLFLIPFAIGNERKEYLGMVKNYDAANRNYWAAVAADPESPAVLSARYTLGDQQIALAKRFPELEGQPHELVKAAENTDDAVKERILPTAFGNTIRAFEDYPAVVYGFDAIQGWVRIEAIMNSTLGNAIQDEKSRVDFWANLWGGSLFLVLAYAGLAFVEYWRFGFFLFPYLWFPFGMIVLSVIFAKAAQKAAYQWGVSIRAAIDLTLPNLAKTLGYTLPASAAKKKEFWQKVSKLFVLRNHAALQDLDPYVPGTAAPPPPPKAAKRSKKAAMPPPPAELDP